MPPAAPRILVIRRRYLGDIALLGSFFRNLRLHWPTAHVTALVERPYAPVLTMQPDVDATLTIPTHVLHWPGWLRALRGNRFTHVFDLDNNDRTALLTRLTGAPFRATLHLEKVRRHFPSFYTHTAFVNTDDYHTRSITETYLSLLATAAVPVVTREVRLVPQAADLAATRALAQFPSPRMLLHPGSRSPFRIWPMENFARLVDRLQNELGVHVSIVGGPSEQPLVEEIFRLAKTSPARIPASLSVPQFAALASQFDAMLCHDSGPMHLAAAVGTPVIALFGSQNATVWGPAGEKHTVLQAPMPCTTCVCPAECVPDDSYHTYCVRRLTVDQVFAAVHEKMIFRGTPLS